MNNAYICSVMSTRLTIRHLKTTLLLRLLAMFFVTAIPMIAHGESVDSLYHAYLNAEAAGKTDIVNTISRILYDDEIIDSLYQCQGSTKPNKVNAIFHYLMAEYYFDQGDYEKALKESTEARDLIASYDVSKLHSDVLGLVSNAHYRLGAIDKSLMTLLEAHKVDVELGDQKLISSDLNSLAAIYLAVQQPEPGIKFIEKAISIERKLKRPDRLAIRLSLAAELYMMDNQLDKAMTAINEAYDLDKSNKRLDKAAMRLSVKAAILERLSRLDEAHATLMQALPTLKNSNNPYSLATCYNQLGSVSKKQGRNQEALDYYKKALEQSIQCRSPKTERDAEHGLWEMLHDSNPEKAIIHLERYAALTDSLFSQMASAQMQVMNATAQHIGDVEYQKNMTIWNRQILWGGVVLALLLSFLLTSIFRNWKRGRNASRLRDKTEELRSHFFTNITNKLQTPLTFIMNAGYHMLETRKTSADENKRIGEMIVKHSNNMLNLVNQLLDIESLKSDTEESEFKRGDIVMFVSMLLDNFTDIAHQRLINLSFSSPVSSMMVEFIPDYIRRICHALISNAIKFTPRNGNITIDLIPLEGSKMRLTVADTGKGIPEDEYDRIFEPMYQTADNGDDGVLTSVELSLVHHLVQALGGTISVESELGKGTKFTVEFPVQMIDQTSYGELFRFAESRINQTGNDKQKPLVFIVENNEQVAFFIASHLKDEFNLRLARDGREALQNAEDLIPDLIITSMVMPVMGGKELIKQLRANPSLSHIPIVAMTSDASEKERMACLELGSDYVLVKPFNSSELRIISNHLVSQKALLRDKYAKTGTELSTNTPMAKISKADKEFINKLVEVILAQMSKDAIDMEHIAAALSLSRKQLRTKVMAITGLTPVAYVLQVRLNCARRMIANEDTSLTTIASKCGFQNLSHFSKAFKQQYGVSPQQYRKSNDQISQVQPKT